MDHNGTPGIQTSAGSQALAWGTDECVAWHADLGGTVQRPVQWTVGELNKQTCEYENQRIWTTTGRNGPSAGQCGSGGIWVHLLDGDTGTTTDEIHIPDSQVACNPSTYALGPYGAAVDSNSDLWFHIGHSTDLIHVPYNDLANYEIIDLPQEGYGIAVDSKDRIWLTPTLQGPNLVQRYDPALKTWASAPGGRRSGLGQDRQGRMWFSDDEFGGGKDAGIMALDIDTLALAAQAPVPGTGIIKGVAVDIDGQVWVNRRHDTQVYAYDPATANVTTIGGLVHSVHLLPT